MYATVPRAALGTAVPGAASNRRGRGFAANVGFVPGRPDAAGCAATMDPDPVLGGKVDLTPF